MSVGRRRVWWVVGGTVVVVAVVVVAFVAFGGGSKTAKKPSATSKVVRSTVTTTVSAEGTVQAQASRTLGFTSSGTLTELDVKAGDTVQVGAVLARIDPTTAQNQVDTATTSVDNAQTSVNTASTELATANAATCPKVTTITTTPARPTPTSRPTTSASASPSASASGSGGGSGSTSGILAAGGTSGGSTGGAGSGAGGGSGAAATCTAATLNAKKQSASDALFNAQQRLNNAEQTLTQARAKLDGTVITAPVAGKVLSVNGSLGATAGSSFLVLAGTDDVMVTAQFTEAEVAHLALKQHATITLPDKAGTTFTGTVTQIDPAGTTSGKLVRYTALISFDKAPGDLLYGQSAVVAVVTAAAADVLSVPATAVYGRTGNTGNVDAMVGGKVVRRTVTIGLRGDVSTEIKAGLSLGDVVLTSPAV